MLLPPRPAYVVSLGPTLYSLPCHLGASTRGSLYLQAAHELPSDEEAKAALLTEGARTHDQLAKDDVAERLLQTGGDVGPGGGPGIRLQSPGRPCPSCCRLIFKG